MSVLKTVKLSSLKPNPFRPPDAPLNEERVGLLVAEMRASKPWRFTARASDLALPFGHHRLEAAKRVLGADAEVDVLLEDIPDGEMVRMLAQENDEEWRHDFLTATLTSVRAYLLAYEAGVVDLTPEAHPKGGNPVVRYTAPNRKPYTAESLADTRGGTWLHKGGAQEKVKAAVALINENLIPDEALTGLGPSEVRTVLEAARAARRDRERTAEAERSVLEDAAKRAERAKDEKGKPAPDTKKAELLRTKIASISEREHEDAEKAAREIAKEAVSMLKKGESIRTVKETLTPIIVAKNDEKLKVSKKEAKVEPYTPEEYKAAVQKLESWRAWVEKETERIQKGRSVSGKGQLTTALTRLVSQLNKLKGGM